MYVIGPLEDQTVGLVWSQISDKLFGSSLIYKIPIYERLFHELVAPWTSSQPIFDFIISIFFTLLGKNGYNILLIVSFILNLIISYLYFRRFKFGYIYSVFYSFSSYIWIHLTHLTLIQIWIFPLFIVLLEKFKNNKLSILFTSIFITISLLLSNYLGFFTLLVFFFDLLSEKISFGYFKRFLHVILLTAILTIVAVAPFIKLNYFNQNTTQIITHRSANQVEDFLIFSSKPWHFLIPSAKNPVYGKEIKVLRTYLEKVRFIIIFDQYFDREHNASFFGFSFLVTLVILSFGLLYKHKQLKMISKYLIISTLIFLFMMPPYILIRGIRFYTPGYIIYTVFPMFRSLSRLSIVLLLYSLTIFGTILDFKYNKYSQKGQKLLKYLIPSIFFFALFEVFVPQSIRKMDEPPGIYSYIGQYTNKSSKIAVYPYSKTNEAVFWLPAHKRELVNPRGYEFYSFNSETFTKKLSTDEGLKVLKEMSVDYLVLFKSADEKSFRFLSNSQKLSLVKEFGDSNLYLIK